MKAGTNRDKIHNWPLDYADLEALKESIAKRDAFIMDCVASSDHEVTEWANQIADLKVVTPIDEELITLLETMTERARAGEIQGAGIFTIEADAAGNVISCGTAYAGQGVKQNVHAAIGIASHLHHRLMELLEA